MKQSFDQANMPQGFSRALMQNMYAQQYFTSLTDDAKQAIISRAAEITSSEEMRQFVDGMVRH